tara:strand:+ start:217 stop:633 length:417 start_codon:yes stop_codon:yes gene_type:complete
MNKPRTLENAYLITKKLITPFLNKYSNGSLFQKIMIGGEKITKKPVFDCKMCGQCILHSTGMVCPMGCPKELRNGPCGGVRQNNSCEIKPEMKCVWVRAWENSKQLKVYKDAILEIQPPVDRSLQGTSSWINEFIKEK